MPVCLQQFSDAARQVLIDQEAHGSSREGVETVAIDRIGRELKSGPDVLRRQVVLALHFLEAHAAGQRSHHHLHRDPCAADHRLTVVPEGAMGDDPHKIDQITGATQTTVAGMGVFLNENFADWHRFLPMLRQCAQSAASAEK